MLDIEKLRKAKQLKNLTFEKLSNASNIPIKTLCDILKGVTVPTDIATIQAIEKALEIDDYNEAEYEKYINEKNKERLLASFNSLPINLQKIVLNLVEGLSIFSLVKDL